jgi:hypothetical protein
LKSVTKKTRQNTFRASLVCIVLALFIILLPAVQLGLAATSSMPRGAQDDPPGPNAQPLWFLAEGSNAWGFRTFICIVNANTIDVTARMTYMPSGAEEKVVDVTLPSASQTTINTSEVITDVDFSTRVECVEGYTIGVDRSMIWGKGTDIGMHASVAVNTTANSWSLTEGCTAGGFETYLTAQNPNDDEAKVYVNYMTDEGARVGQEVTMPPQSRQTFNVADVVPDTYSVSSEVYSDKQIIAERAVYWNNRTGGHESVGVPGGGAKQWYLAEGSTAGGMETWILVANPNDLPTWIDITYLTENGPVQGPGFEIEGRTRKSINVADTVQDAYNVSTIVTAKAMLGILAERAMYGEKRLWGHDSIGVTQPHYCFEFADGASTATSETYTLVQNPNKEDIKVQVVYLTGYQEGQTRQTISFFDSIPANSRKTFNMADHITDGSASILVYSRTEGADIVAERSMYLKTFEGLKYAGSDTIGMFWDQVQ